MAAPTSASANLSLTVAHAISYLTRPLIASHSANAIIKLQLVLEANLTALYAPTWVLKEPLRGSGRRCLTLSPDCLPPRPIYAACIAAGVQWFEWIAALGNREFDLFVDPGCVSVRYGRKNAPNGKFITVWVDEIASPGIVETPFFEAFEAPKPQSKTVAQQLLEDDHEDDEQLFSMIAHEINAPTWTTPVHAQFPAPVRSLSPLSTISSHSRSSSRSSNSSSTFSSSAASCTTSLSAASPAPSSDSKKPKQSRRERARQARVFVDTSKTEVTPYDGGKTTVLTGGVMLGSHSAASKPTKAARPASGVAASWRSTIV
ncbi:putative BTG family protein [Lyophyllum shimeji]|uniref:BTG family protein n=1 Tax=Lyophyllum shimeji TaxID=47721 RepID=A0A9P3PHW0_LYOSH|nr:putative BTG family protein [Lyophyllum shimeji]